MGAAADTELNAENGVDDETKKTVRKISKNIYAISWKLKRSNKRLQEIENLLRSMVVVMKKDTSRGSLIEEESSSSSNPTTTKTRTKSSLQSSVECSPDDGKSPSS